MQAQATSAAVCPECGTRLEGGFSRNLGRCMICLLRVGFDGAEEPNEAPLSSVADRLGNYRIERRDDGSLWELGRGAMGVTYRALDTSLRRAVALKLIDSEWVKHGAEARERFMREARTAAALRHPNVATVYHFGIREENGQCFCAMELVEGETLEMRVRRTGPLDALTTIDIALQVSSALAAAEKQGLVHRDLKPANLMFVAVAPEANDSSPGKAEKADTVVKVIDFGVAKALVEKPDAMGLTHGGFVGTPAFASPEQFTDAPVGVRSDIYSLGATLWYLLTGHRPFEGATIEQIRASQHSQALPIEQLKAARVPSRLISLLASMLAAEPAARPDVRALTLQLQDCRAQILDRWKAARRFTLAAGLIGITAAAFLIFERQNRTISQNTVLSNVSEKTVAVLPFESLSEDKGNAYLAGGVRDEILTKLAQVRGLKVVSRSSTKKNASHPTNLPELGRQLGTDSFLEGSVRGVAADLSIHVQLMDAKTGRQLWAQTYQRPAKDISEVEGEVAHQVAGALKVKLAPGEAQRLRLAATNNPRAHDSWLRARALSAYSDLKSQEEQIALLREAVAEDPHYAVAWAELTGAYIHIADVYRAPREILTPARDAAEQAVAVNEKFAMGHLALASIALSYDWNFPLAKRELERTIALDPDSCDAHRLYGWYLARVERNFVAARQEMAHARALDPLYTWPLWGESSVAIAQGDYESALRLAERVIEINPEFLYDEDPIAHVYVAMGRWQDGLKRYESIPPARFNRPNFELAICYAHTGQIARARDILEKLEKLAQQRYVDHTHIAAIYAALGDNNRAFAALDQAFQDRSARVYAPRFYPWLVPLRADPRFVQLENKIARSQLPQSAEVASRSFDKSIAVLPFVNMSEDKANEYFSDGISEELLNLLAKIPQLQVTARTSSFSFKGKEVAIPEIARTLHVAHVLEGSVRKAGNSVRITAQLVNAGTDTHLWSQTYDRKLDDIFAIQDEIAADVVKQLKVTLLGAPKARTTDPEAYALYLQAVQLGRQGTTEASKQSDALYRKVLAIDPRYAPAWNGLAGNFTDAVSLGLLSTNGGYAQSREASMKALAIDPEYAPAHAWLGMIALDRDNDFAAAAEHFKRALALDPADPSVLEASASFLECLGRLDEALALNEALVRRDPVNVTALFNLGHNQVRAGRLDAGIASYRTALSLSPGRGGAHYQLGAALLLKGDAQGALAEIEQETIEILKRIDLPLAYHALGRKADSDAALAELIAKDEKGASYNIAYVYAFRGEADKAFAWLDKAVEYGDNGLSGIVTNSLFDKIHSDPRWLPFLRKIGKAPEQLAKIEFKVTLPP
jgi:adenylate cyclase